jgi:hypothetical protein
MRLLKLWRARKLAKMKHQSLLGPNEQATVTNATETVNSNAVEPTRQKSPPTNEPDLNVPEPITAFPPLTPDDKPKTLWSSKNMGFMTNDDDSDDFEHTGATMPRPRKFKSKLPPVKAKRAMHETTDNPGAIVTWGNQSKKIQKIKQAKKAEIAARARKLVAMANQATITNFIKKSEVQE